MTETKYYKVISEDKTHHGFKYVDGLNIDTNVFNPNVICDSGLYFTDADHILQFIDYGIWLCEVTIPDDAKVCHEDNKSKSDKIILIGWYDLRKVETWKSDLFKSFKYTLEAMDWAATNGHLEVVKWLQHNRTEGCTEDVMDWVASNGHLEVVKWLHYNRPERCTKEAMDLAAKNGHLEVVKWLHQSRSEGCTKEAMNRATQNGHTEVVKWLHENRSEGCTKDMLY